MSKFCPSCGEELVDNAKFCKRCGMNLENKERPNDINQGPQFRVQSVENKHTAAIVIGYIFSILFSLVGLIIGIYLLTRKDSQTASRHGKYIVILSVAFWIVSLLLL